KKLLGINGKRLIQKANGLDNREVNPNAIYDFKSIGNSTTLAKNTTKENEIREVLKKLCQSVSIRMKRKEVLATKVLVTIRYGNLKTITRSKKLQNPIGEEEDLLQESEDLFFSHWNEEPIRLLGVTGQELVEKDDAVKQLDLFSYEQDAKDEPILSIIDQINQKYGDQLLKRGVKGVKKDSPTPGTSFSKDFLT
ncbi:MAG TPA: DNA polymerase IV, partial [Metabacillus sp.]|nr:DNA polymerase IV [Metabacillus sp.]